MRSTSLSLAAVAALAVACGGEDPNNNNNANNNNNTGLCLDISGSESVDGLSIRRPEDAVDGCHGVAGANEEERLCQQKAPDLTCVGQMEPLGTPINVTFTGCVNSFGLEAQSDDLSVTVLREQVGGTTTDPGYDLAGAAGMQAEKTPGALVGMDPDTGAIGHTRSKTVARDVCFDLGHFSLEGVPTETRLVVRVTDQHVEKSRRQYVDTYQYNVVLRNDAIEDAAGAAVADPATYCVGNPCFVHDDVNTVFETTFKTVALTAGVSRIEGDDDLYDGTGQGHIAGELQDCTSEDTLRNAVVAVDTPVKKLAYFNVGYPPGVGNLEDPKVDQSRSRTNADGLYAAIAADTQDGGQPVKIGAVITRSVCGDDGVCMCKDGKTNAEWPGADTNEAKVEALGTRTIYVYPDSITILTFDRNLYTAP
jgi:hypothetical protein